MQLISRTEIENLTSIDQGIHLSIYLPTIKASDQIEQNPIRAKNLIREAEKKLEEQGWRNSDIDELLKPAKALLDDRDFWRYQSQGLAWLITPNFFKSYRLPLNFEEVVVVGDRFYLKPLTPLFTNNQTFFILALSQNQVRFFKANQYEIDQIDLPDAPNSLAEALQYDDPEKQLQYHSSGSSGTQPMYHGQGVGTTDNKEDIKRYFQQIDAAVYDYLGDQRSPLILVGVEYLHPIYHEVNSYAEIFPDGVTGNPDILKPETLHQQAWEVIQPHWQKQQQAAIAQYYNLAGTGQTSNQLGEIVTAAAQGQVETLFVAHKQHQWGTFDLKEREISLDDNQTSSNEDLLDLATVYTFTQSGTVYHLNPEEIPEQKKIAAIFRYPVVGATLS